MNDELNKLRDLENQFLLGCRNWYLLLLWQRHGSFESSSIGHRIQVAEEVLNIDGRGSVTWAWGGWLQLIDHLIGRLNDGDPHIRQEAAIALGDLQSDGGRAISILLNRVQSTEVTPHDRACAAWALGRIGRHRNEVVPILISVLRDSASHSYTEELRRCVAESIESLTEDCGILLTVARLCLIDPFYKCKLIGLELAERLETPSFDLLPLVRRLIDDELEVVRESSQRFLNRMF